MAVKKFTIKESRFLEWFYSEDYSTESTELKVKLADLVIENLFKSGESSITVADIFKQANLGAIKLYYLEEFAYNTEDYDLELAEFCSNYKVSLTKN